MNTNKGIHLQQWKHGLTRIEAAEREVKKISRRAREHAWAYVAANFVPTSHGARFAVSTAITLAWCEHGVRKFWASGLKHLGSDEDVAEALWYMAQEGMLVEHVTVHIDGEQQWRGGRSTFSDAVLRQLWDRYTNDMDGELITFDDALEELICVDYEYELPVKLDEPPEAI